LHLLHPIDALQVPEYSSTDSTVAAILASTISTKQPIGARYQDHYRGFFFFVTAEPKTLFLIDCLLLSCHVGGFVAPDFDDGFIGGLVLLEEDEARGAKTVFCSSLTASSKSLPILRTILILSIAMRYRLSSCPYSFSSKSKMRSNIFF
jgi:hypothetical protein